MKVVVTGADGFIGSHVTELLVRAGHEVTAMAQYNSVGTAGWLDHVDSDVNQQFNVVLGDVRDADLVDQLLRGQDAVLHLAALIGIPYSYTAPESYLQVNVVGTLNVLQASRKSALSSVILASTSEVFGSAQYAPMDECHPQRAQSPYAASKVAADHLGVAFHCSFGLPVGIVRPFNTFGPRQSLRAVIPTIVAQALNSHGEITLGRTDTKRDFTYVTDTAEAFVLAMESSDMEGQTVNLGTGTDLSISQIAEIVQTVLGTEKRIVSSQLRQRPDASEVTRLVADNARAKQLLGWSPNYVGLEGMTAGIELTIDWFERNGGLVPGIASSGYHV